LGAGLGAGGGAEATGGGSGVDVQPARNAATPAAAAKPRATVRDWIEKSGFIGCLSVLFRQAADMEP